MSAAPPIDFELSLERAEALIAAGTPCLDCGSAGASIATEMRATDLGLVVEHHVVCDQCSRVGHVERTRVLSRVGLREAAGGEELPRVRAAGDR